MAEAKSSSPGETATGGFGDEVRAFMSAISSYVQARLELAGIESKEAAIHYIKAAVWIALAVFGLLFGYVFLIIGIVLVIATLAEWPLMWVVCGAAFLHVVVALLGAFIAFRMFRIPQFQTTLSQFAQDRKWLSNHE